MFNNKFKFKDVSTFIGELKLSRLINAQTAKRPPLRSSIDHFYIEKYPRSLGGFAITRECGNHVWGCREAYTIYYTEFNVTPSVPKWLIGFSLRILSHDGRSPAYITSKMRSSRFLLRQQKTEGVFYIGKCRR